MVKLTYRKPQMVEFGSLLELTRGTGGSTQWDIGSGYKECGGDTGDDGLLEPC